MQIPVQVRRPAIEVMFANQLKTLFDPVETPMYESNANAVETAKAKYGNPFLVVRAKMRGAEPVRARE